MSSGELSTRSWLGLAMYGLAMGLVLFPQRIQLQQRRTVLVLDHRTAPPLAALLLLASTIIPPATFWTGLVGDQQGEGVRPPDVLMLFISLAYVACALDSTGALSALALATVNTLSSHSDDRGRGRGARARGQAPAAAGERTLSGTKLYAALYVLWLLSGAIFGNDPVILSGTAFVAYLTRATGIGRPHAWLVAHFVAANIASAVLVSSNPTNVLIASAFGLDYMREFTAYTVLPSLLASLLAFFVLRVLYGAQPLSRRLGYSPRSVRLASRFGLTLHDDGDLTITPTAATASSARDRYVPRVLVAPENVSARSVLLDLNGAIFHGLLMPLTLIALVVAQTATSPTQGHVPVWLVALVAGLCAVFRDIASDLWHTRKVATTGGRAVRVDEQNDVELDDLASTDERRARSQASKAPSQHDRGPLRSYRRLRHWMRVRLPTFLSTLTRVPFSLVPFALSIFVLSRALSELGWTARWAGSLGSNACQSPASCAFATAALVALVLCPLCATNIGATILAVDILRDPAFRLALASHHSSSPPSSAELEVDRTMRASIYALALASNLGALSWRVDSSLAGMLWRSLLAHKHMRINHAHFAKVMLVLLPPALALACAVILLQIYSFP